MRYLLLLLFSIYLITLWAVLLKQVKRYSRHKSDGSSSLMIRLFTTSEVLLNSPNVRYCEEIVR